MQNTIIGVFDDLNQAQGAMDELLGAGFSRDQLQLNPHADSTGVARASPVDEQSKPERSGSGIGHFLRSLFGMEDQDAHRAHRDMYAEATRRGSSMLTVEAANEKERDRAIAILQRHDPVDLDKRSEHWRSEGWTGAAALGESEKAADHAGVRVFNRKRLDKDPRADTDIVDIGRLYADAEGSSAATGGKDFRDTMAASDDADFRTHWQNAYGRAGGRYEDYDAAYRYGSSVGGSAPYRNYRWEDAEPQMRSDWEARHPESSWERVKDAVRYGAEKVTGRDSARH